MRFRKIAVTTIAGVLTIPALALATNAPAQAAGGNELINPGFERGLKGWTNIGTDGAAYTQTSNPHKGTQNLAHYSDAKWSVNTVQTLRGLDRGTYLLTAWVKNFGATSAGLEAFDCGDTAQTVELPQTTEWSKVTLAVSVFSSSCTVGIYSNSTGGSLVADDFSFTRITPGKGGKMPVGGDITYRRLNMANGAVYSDSDGNKKDVLDILSPAGFNLARIRVYNEPGNTITWNGTEYRLQPGWQDIDDAVQNATDAKARGMKIFLSFHYSDWWTNPSIQSVPKEWKDFTQAEKEQAVYDFTARSLRKMNKAKVSPQFVSIGNEINNAVSDVSRWTNEADYYAMFKSAAKAVRDLSPKSKVVIHLTIPEKWGYNDWASKAKQYGVDYDVLGVSAYPFWTNQSIATLTNFTRWVAAMSGKEVMICEIGYPWTLEAAGEGEITSIEENNLDADGPENYGATTTGQLRYMREYIRAMYETARPVGISYWDPINVDLQDGADPNGWVVGGDAVNEDTTFFDYSSQHKALPSLQAFNTW